MHALAEMLGRVTKLQVSSAFDYKQVYLVTVKAEAVKETLHFQGRGGGNLHVRER